MVTIPANAPWGVKLYEVRLPVFRRKLNRLMLVKVTEKVKNWRVDASVDRMTGCAIFSAQFANVVSFYSMPAPLMHRCVISCSDDDSVIAQLAATASLKCSASHFLFPANPLYRFLVWVQEICTLTQRLCQARFSKLALRSMRMCAGSLWKLIFYGCFIYAWDKSSFNINT